MNAILITTILMLTSCNCVDNYIKPPIKVEREVTYTRVGLASHYSVKTNGGRHTASGEKLSDGSYTAAHPSLPFGSKVKVTNLKNNKTAIVRINNRGPYAVKHGRAIRPLRPHPSRIIDVSQAVAYKLGFHESGITKVKIEVIKTEIQ